MSKVYQVIIEDEYCNLYHYGFFGSLDEATVEINKFIERDNAASTDALQLPLLKKGELKEYVSSVGPCFDHQIIVESEDGFDSRSIMVRGFIFDSLSLELMLESLNEKEKKTEEKR